MSILPRLAGAQSRKDEEPNKRLGEELARNRDLAGIREVADNLLNEDKRVRTDCLSVLEQVGLLEPELIAEYVPDFLKLVFSRDNRLVWAAMINLAMVAEMRADEVFEQRDKIISVIDKGSVITQDNGIKVLARVASANPEYAETIVPYLMDQLRNCRPKSVPQYAESTLVAVGPGDRDDYVNVLSERLGALSTSQQGRVRKLLRSV